jgi:hypothetical protein
MSITLIVMMITITISSIIVFMNIIISTLYYRENNTQMNTFWRFIGTRLPWSRHDNIVMPLQDEKTGPSSSWKEKTKDQATRTSLKAGDELSCSGRDNSSCPTCGTRRINLMLTCSL